ncbi:MAG: ribonuclease III [Candidatus Ancaeobacter aquaticus]|nr:ribonuclease III [Candidatus Ancaeobacter aquaticus]
MKCAQYALLEKKIEYVFKDRKCIEQALTHTSYVHELNDSHETSNERMELLGDAVIGMVVTEYLYTYFPDYSEGEMTIIKSRLVRGEYLSKIASEISLGKYISLGRGEEKLGGRHRETILAATYEALVAAIYLDGGLSEARRVIVALMKKDLDMISQSCDYLDSKSRLQKITQAEYGVIPEYTVLKEDGPSHKKEFKVCGTILDKYKAKATGSSKKAAQQAVAALLIKQINNR